MERGGTGGPRTVSAVRRHVARWGLVLLAVLGLPGTVLSLRPWPPDLLAAEFFAFVWSYLAIGYFLGIWLAPEVETKGLNGVAWGLLLVGPWWPFTLVVYAFSTQPPRFLRRPT